jgi:hypothetical protein
MSDSPSSGRSHQLTKLVSAAVSAEALGYSPKVIARSLLVLLGTSRYQSGERRETLAIKIGAGEDWRATMRWQDQLQEGDEVVGAIRNPR